MVQREDARAEALRESGAKCHRKPENPVMCNALEASRDVFQHECVCFYLEATTVVCSLAAEFANLDVLVNMSQMTVSQMTRTSTAESHQQRVHRLTEQVMDWSRIRAVQMRPTALLRDSQCTVLAAHAKRG